MLAPMGVSAQETFFPERPPKDVKLNSVKGILVDYGIGNKSGSFSIRIENANSRFFIGWPMRINEKLVTCSLPPFEGFTPDPEFVIAHPGSGSGAVRSAERSVSSTGALLALAVLTTERKAA